MDEDPTNERYANPFNVSSRSFAIDLINMPCKFAAHKAYRAMDITMKTVNNTGYQTM